MTLLTKQGRKSIILMDQEVTKLINEAKIFERALKTQKATQKFEAAFNLALQVANLLKNDVNCEPARSLCYWNASWLALKLDNRKEAFELAVEGKRFCQAGSITWGNLEELRLKTL